MRSIKFNPLSENLASLHNSVLEIFPLKYKGQNTCTAKIVYARFNRIDKQQNNNGIVIANIPLD